MVQFTIRNGPTKTIAGAQTIASAPRFREVGDHRLRRLTSFAVGVGLLGFSAPALAHDVAVTISPLHLILPVVELTGEFKVAPKVGLAAIAGFGSTSAKVIDASGDPASFDVSLYELGASARLYVLGDFDHGMQLGAEALYVHLSSDASDIKGTAAGFGLGPFVGYKVSTDGGFTFDSQLGFQYIAASATAESDEDSASADDSGVVVLLNLNLGWAF